MSAGRRVCLGIIQGVHGVRGVVKIKSFTDPADALATYAGLCNADGARVALSIKSQQGALLLAAVAGVADRTAAEKLRGQSLFVPRADLPPPREGEYYLCDLEGMALRLADGSAYGTVVSAQDYGAGVVLEVEDMQGQRALWPFRSAFFPVVDVASGTAIFAPPLESLVEDAGA